MKTQNEILEDIKFIKEQKLDVYIYGAGRIGTGVGRTLLRLLDMSIAGYCDTNVQKRGIEIEEGVLCYLPKEISKKKNKACFLMLGQNHKESGLKVVEKLDFDIIITYDELCSLDLLIDKFIDDSDSTNFWKVFKQKREIFNNLPKEKKIKIVNKKNKPIVIYTCITGNYDDVVEPQFVSEECDYYLISDYKPENLKVYRWLDIKEIVPDWVDDNRRRNRYCKINVSEIFEEYRYSIYIDGNIKIVNDVTTYIEKIGKSGFASHLHAYNNCLYVEAVKVVDAGVEDEHIAKAQVKLYREEGMPHNFGHYENRVLVREHNNPVCKKLMSDWWQEVYTKSYRDQLSLTYCIWKNNINKDDIGILGSNSRQNKDFVLMKDHHL